MQRHVEPHSASLSLLVCLALVVGAAGCMPQTFSGVGLGTMGHAAVGSTLGADAVRIADGYSLDVHNPWPTVIQLVHVAVPEAGAAEWKLLLQGSVTHLIVVQLLGVEVVYEGPLPEELLHGLRAPEEETESEFRAALVAFVQSRVLAGMTDKWNDPETLRNDPHRSRFIGLYEACLVDLRGRGTLRRERFDAAIDAGGTSLKLRYLGSGTYRIEARTSASLGPLPVL